MTHDELDRLNRRWGNHPPEVMTEGEYSQLREVWEDKVSHIREAHGLDDTDARAAACEMFPRIIGELLSHPTRVSRAATLN